MRIEWINKKGGGRVVVFFNGWGLDARAVSQLDVTCDLLMCNDYRTLECAEIPSFSGYERIDVIAWSMGVWAAANVIPLWKIKPDQLIVLNGTEWPVDDKYGIPVQLYTLTENGMNERGREKFFSRMLVGKEEISHFTNQKPRRELTEQLAELKDIRRQAETLRNTLKWDKVFVSEKDVIFPVNNQLCWWNEKVTVTMLPGGHYPFYQFKSWDEITG